MPALRVELKGQSLPARIALGAAGLAIVALGFFFFAAALVAGTLVAAGLLLRHAWRTRRARPAAREDSDIITTEYRVIESEQPPAPRLPQ